MHEPAQQSVSSDDVSRYFTRYGWSSEQVDEHTFRTGFSGKNSSFTALIRLSQHWVEFTINPFLRADENGWGKATQKLLVHANHQINMAKFGIDSDNDCFLTVELPTEHFCYEHFAEAMTALTHAADALVLPLMQARAIDRTPR